jgi:type II secretion system protein J
MGARIASPRRRGMTLIEVSLAVAILAMIGALTWGSIARSFDAYETVKDIDRRYHNARVAMNRMARELSMAYLTSQRRHRGQERVVRQVFKYEDSSPLPSLHFSCFCHQILLKDAKESDQAEISYFGENDPDEAGIVNLMRREAPRIDADWDEGGRAYVLAEDVKEFSLRFFDPRKDDWTDEWDTENAEFAGRLPTVVEIRMTVEDEAGEDLTFLTKTRINLSEELGTL